MHACLHAEMVRLRQQQILEGVRLHEHGADVAWTRRLLRRAERLTPTRINPTVRLRRLPRAAPLDDRSDSCRVTTPPPAPASRPRLEARTADPASASD
jgi:hypothetical protein